MLNLKFKIQFCCYCKCQNSTFLRYLGFYAEMFYNFVICKYNANGHFKF